MTTDTDIQKKILRKEILVLKKKQSEEEKHIASEIIIKKIEETAAFKDAHTIMVFWSMSDEVMTHEAVRRWSRKKKIILPCVKGDTLELREFKGMESMKIGESFGIAEPVGPLFVNRESLQLIITPGVAFDISKNRMGRGKAYYDGLLTSTIAVKMGICYDFQLLDCVPIEKHDIPMDAVITEKRSII